MFQVHRKVIFSYTNTHTLFFRLFSILGYYKILTIVPVLYSKSLLLVAYLYFLMRNLALYSYFYFLIYGIFHLSVMLH